MALGALVSVDHLYFVVEAEVNFREIQHCSSIK